MAISASQMVSIAKLLENPANRAQVAIHQKIAAEKIALFARQKIAAPIWISADFVILDGFHRVAAAIQRGDREIAA
jgi:hypothetical protein